MNGRAQRDVRDLIFFGDEDPTEEYDFDQLEQALREMEVKPESEAVADEGRIAVYVQILERAINTVASTAGDMHLFSREEWLLVHAISKLQYCSRFLLSRLVRLRKGWHSRKSLKYIGEIGEAGMTYAFRELCGPLPRDKETATDKDGNIQEVIDLSFDSDDEDETQDGSDTSHSLNYFCQDETKMSLSEGLHCLPKPEVKRICKEMKVPHLDDDKKELRKHQMTSNLLNRASMQSVLPFTSAAKTKGKGKCQGSGLRQATLPFAPVKGQTAVLKKKMLDALGSVIRVNPIVYTLMMRLHIIWLRATEIPEALFFPAVMASFKKRTYATYPHVRDPAIWPSRERYLEYEIALQLEALIDELLQPEPRHPRKPIPAATILAPRLGIPGLEFLRDIAPAARTPSATPIDAEEPPSPEDSAAVDPKEVARQKAVAIHKIYKGHALQKWRELAEADEDMEERRPGLVRFEAGFVYTRIMRKCGTAMATLKEFAAEKEMLDILLGQRKWRRGKRGGWYDRRALLQMTYLHKDDEGNKDMGVLQQAREGVIEGLEDEDTTTVARPPLMRRLVRLEKTLKVPNEERCNYDIPVLNDAPEVYVNAIRVWDEPNLKLDANGRVIKAGKENKTANVADYFQAAPGVGSDAPAAGVTKKAAPKRWTGKSLWQGKDDVVNVETRALEHYEQLGFKGFHSETQIMTTLFGLLFWDIIFADVPGAFETPWQTGPLDVAEDSFYYARQNLMETRLQEIKVGEARRILEANDDRYREDKTCCMGVHWDLCGRDDLVEIVECLGGDVLSSICRLFCEDYAGRSSGAPDLIVWNPETKECKFVEVKGPGDTLAENQKLWSDALYTARCAVEVCKVLDGNNPPVKKEKKAPVKKKTEAKAKTPKPRAKAATASTSKGKGKARAQTPVESELDDEGDCLVDNAVAGDDDGWEPSTTLREQTPPCGMKRRRAVDDDDEMPVFLSPPPPNPMSGHQPPALACKWPVHTAEVLLSSPSKKRKTI